LNIYSYRAGIGSARDRVVRQNVPADLDEQRLCGFAGCGHPCAMASYIGVAGVLVGILVGVTQLIDWFRRLRDRSGHRPEYRPPGPDPGLARPGSATVPTTMPKLVWPRRIVDSPTLGSGAVSSTPGGDVAAGPTVRPGDDPASVEDAGWVRRRATPIYLGFILLGVGQLAFASDRKFISDSGPYSAHNFSEFSSPRQAVWTFLVMLVINLIVAIGCTTVEVVAFRYWRRAGWEWGDLAGADWRAAIYGLLTIIYLVVLAGYVTNHHALM
jgi:hypothetical protein